MELPVIALIFGGAWVSMVLATVLKRFSKRLDSNPSDIRFEELVDDARRLERRLEQVEEELGFLRELHRPKAPRELSSPEGGTE